jgi:hypothetical protein
LPGALTNALVVVKNAVLTEFIVDVSAPSEDPVPRGSSVDIGET